MLAKLIRTVALLSLAILLMSAAMAARSQTEKVFKSIVPDEDKFYLPPPIWLKLFSTGYNEAVADFLWAKTLVYFGGKETHIDKKKRGKKGEKSTAKYTTNYLKIVSALDPKFLTVYENGSTLTLYHQGNIDRQTVKMAIEILDEGLKHFPDDGGLTFDLGFLHYYEMPPVIKNNKEKKKHRRKGAFLMRRASTLPGAPETTSTLAASLLEKQGLKDIVIDHIKSMLLHETSPEIRERLEIKLRQELGEAAERDIQRSEVLRTRWQKDLPFISFDLYLALQPQSKVTTRDIANPLLFHNRSLGIE